MHMSVYTTYYIETCLLVGDLFFFENINAFEIDINVTVRGLV